MKKTACKGREPDEQDLVGNFQSDVKQTHTQPDISNLFQRLERNKRAYREEKDQLFTKIEENIVEAEEAYEEHYDSENMQWHFKLELFGKRVSISFHGGDTLKIEILHRELRYRLNDPPHFLYHEWGASLSGGYEEIASKNGFHRFPLPVKPLHEKIYRFVIKHLMKLCAIAFEGSESLKEDLARMTEDVGYHFKHYMQVAFLEGEV